ncbi:hypothetical protein ABT083_31375 [Streptomyces goshikiensis]|uniref:hypothetical protein n=1 Tax=Streptomyces goshikiensis TaxID=1942 RepID=UPI00332E3733
MTYKLPLLSAQLAFGLDAQRSGRRATVTLMFRTPPSRMSADDVRRVLQSVVLRNPALSYRIRFSRGVAYQEWHPTAECDFLEIRAASADAVPGRAMEVIEEFETSLDGAAMAARLIRSPESDDLLLVFDHALVDEQSLLIIKRQLDSPSPPDERQPALYQASVEDRRAFETAVTNGAGIGFWADRLKSAVGNFPQAQEKPTRVILIDSLPAVAVPRSFRGSLFPYVLFSIHRALRDVGEPGPTVIGYPWGGRNAAYSDVVGCFMNTAISVDASTPQQAPQSAGEFLNRWYEEIDHADVPFTAVSALRSGFSGSLTAQLSYTHSAARPVKIAGIEAVEVVSTLGRAPQSSAFLAAATVRENDIQLRLLLDEQAVGYGAQEFGARWRHWLNIAILSFIEQKA